MCKKCSQFHKLMFAKSLNGKKEKQKRKKGKKNRKNRKKTNIKNEKNENEKRKEIKKMKKAGKKPRKKTQKTGLGGSRTFPKPERSYLGRPKMCTNIWSSIALTEQHCWSKFGT